MHNTTWPPGQGENASRPQEEKRQQAVVAAPVSPWAEPREQASGVPTTQSQRGTPAPAGCTRAPFCLPSAGLQSLHAPWIMESRTQRGLGWRYGQVIAFLPLGWVSIWVRRLGWRMIQSVSKENKFNYCIAQMPPTVPCWLPSMHMWSRVRQGMKRLPIRRQSRKGQPKRMRTHGILM